MAKKRVVKNNKHLFYSKNWFVFPVAFGWENKLMEYIPEASRLTIHFLWWHWRWTFIKEEER